MRCDKDGVPLLIQSMQYHYGPMLLKVELFSGDVMTVPVEKVVHVGIMEKDLTKMQKLEAENNLTKHLLDNWVMLGLGQRLGERYE